MKLEEPCWDQDALDVLVWRIEQLEAAAVRHLAVNEALLEHLEQSFFGPADKLKRALREALK